MTSLLQLVEELVRDPVAKTAYAADPDVYLDRHGFGDLDAEDIAEALSHVADSFPPLLAAQLTPQDGLTSLAGVDLVDLGLDHSFAPLPILTDLDFDVGASDVPGAALEPHPLAQDVDLDHAFDHDTGPPVDAD